VRRRHRGIRLSLYSVIPPDFDPAASHGRRSASGCLEAIAVKGRHSDRAAQGPDWGHRPIPEMPSRLLGLKTALLRRTRLARVRARAELDSRGWAWKPGSAQEEDSPRINPTSGCRRKRGLMQVPPGASSPQEALEPDWTPAPLAGTATTALPLRDRSPRTWSPRLRRSHLPPLAANIQRLSR